MDSSGSERRPPVLIESKDRKELAFAKALLENPGLTARLANVIGTPIEKGFALLPKGWTATVQHAVRAALFRALQLAVTTLNTRSRKRSSELFHKVIVGTSGGVGGAFGLPALAIELPISTTIMLRSIADIARTEGHDLKDISTRLNCLEVFALGGRSREDDAAEGADRAVRAAMSRAVSEAASYFAEKGMLEKERAGCGPARVGYCRAVWRGGFGASGCEGASDRGSGGRFARQRAVHGSFPEHGPWTFYCETAGKEVRDSNGSGGLRRDQAAGAILAL